MNDIHWSYKLFEMHEPEKQLKGGCVILYFYTITPFISCIKNQEMDILFIACRSKLKRCPINFK